MLQLNATNKNARYCCTRSTGMSVQVTSGQWACLFYFLPTSCSGIIATRSADIFTMFDYVALDQHTCLKPSSYVCNSFTRLAGMLQYHVLNVVLNQQACLLQLHPTTWHDSTSMHVCWSCIYHQICLNQLQLTYKHICSCVAETACIYVSLASDPQLCLYTSTQLTGW